MATYAFTDIAGTPITANTAIDSGVGSALMDRPSTFTPPAGYASVGPTADYAVAVAPSVRPMVFEAASTTVTIDPGLAVSG